MQYGMFCMYQCEQSGELENVFETPIHQTAHTDAYKTPYCIYSCLPEDEPKKFETCRRQQKLKIKYKFRKLRISLFFVV